MLNMINEFNNMFKYADAFLNYPPSCEETKNRGLRRLIQRPHNLITVKDENGKVSGYKIELVYTPFKKSEVKVEVEKNLLIVRCGSKNKTVEESMDYCGISYQSYEFSIPLPEYVDNSKITAEAEDGMLRIHVPVKVETEDNGKIQIEVK